MTSNTSSDSYWQWTYLITALAALVALTSIIVRKAHTPRDASPEPIVTSDTIIVRDTIYISTPLPVATTPLGFAAVTLPTWRPPAGTTSPRQESPAEAPRETSPAAAPRATPPQGSDSLLLDADPRATTQPPDSATVVLAIEQKHYATDDYEAWISGWHPSLDSLRIYRSSRRITTELRPPGAPRRWGLSIGAGIAATPSGTFHPCLFLGATYTFLAF